MVIDYQEMLLERGAQQVLQGEVVKQFLQHICFPLREQLLQYYPIWLRMYGKTSPFSIPWKMVRLLNLFSNQDGQPSMKLGLLFLPKKLISGKKFLSLDAKVYLQTSDASLASRLCEMCAANNNVDTLHRIFITSQAEVLPS
ncbi:uncharacterized protein LOC142625718 [Castanea sativa]|uniref:uncharacterized protein LOC142625718 n=1 Tax=Castanea sativa TaxID=21020 RepID=UPI003F652BC4